MLFILTEFIDCFPHFIYDKAYVVVKVMSPSVSHRNHCSLMILSFVATLSLYILLTISINKLQKD